ncbi:MAG: rhodanese-like domain-containing protein [Actinomycetota bacterium]|jgi:phage shock protein E
MRIVRVATVLLAAVVLGLGSACSSDDGGRSTARGVEQTPGGTEAAFVRLDPAAFADRMQNKEAMVINVHIPYEGELERTDAFIPYDKIMEDSRLPQDKDREILLYCRSGSMSEEAGAEMLRAGYTKVAHLEGGMKGWEAAGRPLINNPANASETPAGEHDGGMR